MEYHNMSSPSSSNKAKHRHHHYLTACFRSSAEGDVGGYRTLLEAPSLIRSPSTWLRSMAQELPKQGESSRSLFTGACAGGARHRRRHSGDFRYRDGFF
ncbi:uncharacterized protein [Typha latifolia]|uniref:uncharacterized protein n=1 Tax=Typha latifolia TaxID=4733 RepID=UPI003C2C3DE8